jgi:hypothetical protein
MRRDGCEMRSMKPLGSLAVLLFIAVPARADTVALDFSGTVNLSSVGAAAGTSIYKMTYPCYYPSWNSSHVPRTPPPPALYLQHCKIAPCIFNHLHTLLNSQNAITPAVS